MADLSAPQSGSIPEKSRKGTSSFRQRLLFTLLLAVLVGWGWDRWARGCADAVYQFVESLLSEDHKGIPRADAMRPLRERWGLACTEEPSSTQDVFYFQGLFYRYGVNLYYKDEEGGPLLFRTSLSQEFHLAGLYGSARDEEVIRELLVLLLIALGAGGLLYTLGKQVNRKSPQPATAPPLPEVAPGGKGYLLLSWGVFLVSAVAACCVYWPARTLPFRVDAWDFSYAYASHAYDLTNLSDLGQVAFWTPYHDFRLIPLAWLWNYGVYSLLGSHFEAHWMLSMGLHLLNALLLAWWVGSLYPRPSFARGLLAASLFLLFPGNFEMIVWTFFTWKLLHVSLVLLSFLLYERFLRTEKTSALLAALTLLFLSTFVYESSLLLFGTFFVRLWACDRLLSPASYRTLCGSVLVAVLYAGISILARNYLAPLYGLHTASPPFAPAIWCAVGGYWLWNGLLLTNSGLPVVFVVTDLWIFTRVEAQVLGIVVCVVIWLFLLTAARWEWKKIVYFLSVGVSGSLLVLIGRSWNLPWHYLGDMAIYHYFPTLALAALLGYSLGLSYGPGTTRLRSFAVLAALALCAGLLTRATSAAVNQYIELQADSVAYFAEVEQTLKEHPSEPVQPPPHRLLCSPAPLSEQEHTYHALYVLFGDRILPPAGKKAP